MSVAIVASRDFNLRDVISRSPVAEHPQSEKVLRRWLMTSEEVWLGMHDEEVACVWGLAPPTLISNRAYLWLLTTELVDQHKFLFVRHSQVVIKDALEKWPTIHGHVAVGNDRARKWLRWLRADIKTPQKGWSEFVIRRK